MSRLFSTPLLTLFLLCFASQAHSQVTGYLYRTDGGQGFSDRADIDVLPSGQVLLSID